MVNMKGKQGNAKMKKVLLATLLLASTAAQSQSMTIVQNRLLATGPKMFAGVIVKNFNNYKQTYNISRNGKMLNGEITLHPGESREINVGLKAVRGKVVVHRVCLVSQPLPTQINGIALCKNIYVKG